MYWSNVFFLLHFNYIRIYYDRFVEFYSNYIMCICYCVHMLHDDVCIVCKLLFSVPICLHHCVQDYVHPAFVTLTTILDCLLPFCFKQQFSCW